MFGPIYVFKLKNVAVFTVRKNSPYGEQTFALFLLKKTALKNIPVKMYSLYIKKKILYRFWLSVSLLIGELIS